MIKTKNIYLSHCYKSRYNLILIDECVCPELKDYLLCNISKYFKKKFTLLSVNHEPKMKGMNDRDLSDLCYDYNGVLITADKDFFNTYLGYKILYYEGLNWNKIIQKSAKFLKINSLNMKQKA
ncbi:MAG: hypothetical protein WC376_00565 [Candidatus Nanoarchaeia archaeon]|jgi:hypothetical protein